MTNAALDFSELEFTSEAELQYFSEAVLGEEIRNFLNSTTGKYLHGRAINMKEEAKEQLLKHSPDTEYGRRKIQRLQRNAEMAEMFMRWCAEGIHQGNEAYHQLQVAREQ